MPSAIACQQRSRERSARPRLNWLTITTSRRPRRQRRAGLLCIGSQAPSWLAASGLACCPSSGRLRTSDTLQVLGQTQVFAAGDCAVLDAHPRAPSGVWAVRAAVPLARNLEGGARGEPLQPWTPQRQALQLLGGFQNGQPTAWGLRGSHRLFGPHPLLWRWKRSIDARFMAMFERNAAMDDAAAMACRGCAAKLPAAPLERALQQAGIGNLGSEPEDAAVLPVRAGGVMAPVLQSVDGFPALISDPWLNGRLTALHACSDLWACGALVTAAQAVITLPETTPDTQEMLLAQTLAGIRSALDPQGAQLIGGHTLEARDGTAPPPLSRAVQVILNVSGSPANAPWPKAGLQAGDRLLLSRPLGTGVLFAAAMRGAVRPAALDSPRSDGHQSAPVGGGAAGPRQPAAWLGSRRHRHHRLRTAGPPGRNAAQPIAARGARRPGHSRACPKPSTCWRAVRPARLAPANRRAWAQLDDGSVDLNLSEIRSGSLRHQALLELLVDPQTCGPLLISVTDDIATALLNEDDTTWTEIGWVTPR